MVTTATENGLLPQHAVIWGVPRLGATAAVGNVVIAASGAVPLPQGALLTVDGSAQWSVNVATEIAAGATAEVAVTATVAGPAGNLAANTALTFLSPVAGVLSATVDQDGLAGGNAIEAVESWRARIIAAIRNPPQGGSASDYERWASDAGAAYVRVIPSWMGIGTVGVIVAMSGGVAATAAQIAVIQAYIDARRPVRGNVIVASAIIVPQDLTIVLNPNTQAAQAAVTSALTAWYLAQGINPTLYVAAIDSQITQAAGATNTLVSPTADQTLAANQMAVLGTITFEVPS
nr:baseplate J/gp47 family protein [Acidomonas methanolica]